MAVCLNRRRIYDTDVEIHLIKVMDVTTYSCLNLSQNSLRAKFFRGNINMAADVLAT